MKPPRRLSCLLLLLLSATVLSAEEPKPTAPPPTSIPALLGKWSVRVEVLMVALPEEKALALLPALRDDAKIEGACAELMAAVQRKEGTLTGYPLLVLSEGQDTENMRSQTNAEKIYPTTFQPPQTPTNFEKRNTGPELAVARCQVSDDGRFIGLEMSVKRVELLGFDAYKTEPPNPAGVAPAIEQPFFFESLIVTRLTAQSGQRTLLGVHKLTRPDGYMEFFVLQAQAKPMH